MCKAGVGGCRESGPACSFCRGRKEGRHRRSRRLRKSIWQSARLRHLRRTYLLHSYDSRDLYASTKTARCRTPLQSFWLSVRAPALYHWRECHSRRALHLSNCNDLAGSYHRAERGADLFPVAEISRRSSRVCRNRIKLTPHGKFIRKKATREADGRSAGSWRAQPDASTRADQSNCLGYRGTHARWSFCPDSGRNC